MYMCMHAMYMSHIVYTMYNRSSFCTQVLCGVVYKVYYIDSMVEQFTVRFNTYYTAAVATDFTSLSLPAQVDYVRYLFKVRASYNVVSCHRWDLILLVCSTLTHLLPHSYTHYLSNPLTPFPSRSPIFPFPLLSSLSPSYSPFSPLPTLLSPSSPSPHSLTVTGDLG